MGLLNCADKMLLVLIVDICNAYEIVTYESYIYSIEVE